MYNYQRKAINMGTNVQPYFVTTSLGKIAVFQKQESSLKTPIIFLHGVYFDHHLWDEVITPIKDRMIITLDMPWHGESKIISKNKWNLHDCATMLLEILDSLQISKVIAVGHSWGSMTILRAANRQADRFEQILLCNMPFQKATKKQHVLFNFQHLMLRFRDFYSNQAAYALFAKSSLKKNPQLVDQLKRPMILLSNAEIKHIDQTVILDAEDGTPYILDLKCKALALKGEEDYVPTPPGMETMILKGGHVSPLEIPDKVLEVITHSYKA